MTPSMQTSAIVGVSGATSELRGIVQRIARTEISVLIVGPTGSGKELVAQEIHRWSGRPGNWVALNVCAIAEGMFEAHLFGHVRGAFTGAVRDCRGLLLEADRGTLFLDEINGMTPAGQAKLLRAIETRVFRPVGANSDRRSTFRVVSATNEPLDHSAGSGHFRVDLLHRLSGIVIRVPPLRERVEDIPPLVEHLLRTGGSGVVGSKVTSCGLHVLKRHSWPGNVRELRNVLERAVVLSPQPLLDAGAIDLALKHGSTGTSTQHRPSKRQAVLNALEVAGWDTARAAVSLGIHRATLYRWMHSCGVGVRSGVRHGRDPTGGLVPSQDSQGLMRTDANGCERRGA